MTSAYVSTDRIARQLPHGHMLGSTYLDNSSNPPSSHPIPPHHIVTPISIISQHYLLAHPLTLDSAAMTRLASRIPSSLAPGLRCWFLVPVYPCPLAYPSPPPSRHSQHSNSPTSAFNPLSTGPSSGFLNPSPNSIQP
ncbi:hypothetical protein BO71DRAFT_188652 [Aspergillus ellipticus CBS 707.79]|uniref:Uncharacterized protein n=1 Tax=Aspergillus ellipticus CBS 707.79 TaxID=1448320 RepID=A0A319EWT3_9EURO|nr:hypothetical protein BO71DRAFT_188652 [Aspergillus ellipticus CBS 707.79]